MSPASIHKMLIHESLAIKYVLVPFGQLSEEAQEPRNKNYLRSANTIQENRYLLTQIYFIFF